MRQKKSLTIRVSDEFLAGLDDVRRLEQDVPSRAEMLRRMVERARPGNQVEHGDAKRKAVAAGS